MMRDEDDHERWMRLGRRLRELDPARFKRVLAIVEGYVSIYENPDDDEDRFQALLRQSMRGTVFS